MSKESKSKRALTGSRILDKSIPACRTILEEGQWNGKNGWLPLATPGQGVYYESYFDLSAYELDDLTLVPKLIQLQDGIKYISTTVGEGVSFTVYDVVSQERLTPDDFLLYSIFGDYPSSPGSTEDWEQILMMNYRFMVPSTEFIGFNMLLPATSGSFGSNEATAVQKLWLYRIILTGGPPLDGDIITIPATRFVLGAEIVDEPDLEYIMRLKRSYELATQG